MKNTRGTIAGNIKFLIIGAIILVALLSLGVFKTGQIYELKGGEYQEVPSQIESITYKGVAIKLEAQFFGDLAESEFIVGTEPSAKTLNNKYYLEDDALVLEASSVGVNNEITGTGYFPAGTIVAHCVNTAPQSANGVTETGCSINGNSLYTSTNPVGSETYSDSFYGEKSWEITFADAQTINFKVENNNGGNLDVEVKSKLTLEYFPVGEEVTTTATESPYVTSDTTSQSTQELTFWDKIINWIRSLFQ